MLTAYFVLAVLVLALGFFAPEHEATLWGVARHYGAGLVLALTGAHVSIAQTAARGPAGSFFGHVAPVVTGLWFVYMGATLAAPTNYRGQTEHVARTLFLKGACLLVAAASFARVPH